MNDSLCNAGKMWRLGSRRDGIPLVQNTPLGISAPSADDAKGQMKADQPSPPEQVRVLLERKTEVSLSESQSRV